MNGSSTMMDTVFFFFQAEDGIRDLTVTGVQTCALPISGGRQRQGQVRCARRPRRPMTPPAARGVLATISEKLRFPACKAIQILPGQARRQHARGCWRPFLGESHRDRKSTRLNSSHSQISYAVFCLKKKK